MIIISILVNLVIAAAGTNSEYCDASTKSCEIETELAESKKLIFYDVNPPEGFNLRRDVYMRFAIMISEAQKRGKSNWELVLPPWYNLYHWKTDRRTPTPWSKFFDVKSLKSFAPVVEMHEIFSRSKKKVLEIDTLYILENFEDAFENGVFEERWELIGECDHEGLFWGYSNVTAKEVLCVKFQGKNSKLWELVALHPHDKKIMFAHGEIPLHDSYGTKTYWDCRKSMKYNRNLVKIAKKYIKQYLNCDTDQCTTYLSVHWRRQDFARSRGNDVPSITGTVKQIHKALKKLPNIKKVFIATDASMSELNNLEKELSSLGYEIHFFLPSTAMIEEYGDGGIAIIDQIICSHAVHFIGTHESTFTFRIQEEREILGFDSSTTFNRLCPDMGHCERVSKWTIVH
uniref:GDP-fucose protein O-fucosyltransferase 2 n=1 Tax=Heliothis virescens TaxID=7102 RepID=A0A2A4KA84_HELVI